MEYEETTPTPVQPAAMKTYNVWLGDREWEQVHGECLVGTVEASSLEEARKRVAMHRFRCIRSHDVSPGYWVCEAK